MHPTPFRFSRETCSWRRRRMRVLHWTPLLSVLLSTAACASAGTLAEHDFRGRTVGVVALGQPRPEILTNAVLELNRTTPLQTVLQIGADVLKEVEAARARGRLDEAALAADVPGRMMDRLLHGVAGELRATPEDDPRRAEFELEVRVKEYGIDADHWLGPAHFFLEAELVLRESASGTRIWRGKTKERTPLTPSLVVSGTAGTVHPNPLPVAAANDVLTAAALASLSPLAMQEILEALADHSADALLRSFRRGLEKSRS